MKKNKEINNTLSPLAYEVTQQAGTENHFQGNTMIFLIKEPITVYAVVTNFSILRANLNQVVVGPAFLELKVNLLNISLITLLE